MLQIRKIIANTVWGIQSGSNANTAKFVHLWKTRIDISQKLLLALIDRPFDCPIIYTNTNSQCHFVHGHLNNAWHKKAHFWIGKPCLMIIASKYFMEKMLCMSIDWFSTFLLTFSDFLFELSVFIPILIHKLFIKSKCIKVYEVFHSSA